MIAVQKRGGRRKKIGSNVLVDNDSRSSECREEEQLIAKAQDGFAKRGTTKRGNCVIRKSW